MKTSTMPGRCGQNSPIQAILRSFPLTIFLLRFSKKTGPFLLPSTGLPPGLGPDGVGAASLPLLSPSNCDFDQWAFADHLFDVGAAPVAGDMREDLAALRLLIDDSGCRR